MSLMSSWVLVIWTVIVTTYWQPNALWIGNLSRLEQMLEMIRVVPRTVFKPSVSYVMGKVKCIKIPSSDHIFGLNMNWSSALAWKIPYK